MANKQLIGAYSDYLNTLNIHVLRNLARQVGVYKPTEGKKQNLIERTIAVLIGEVVPVPPSKLGAPLKEDVLDEKYLRQLDEIKNDYTYYAPEGEPSFGVSTSKKEDVYIPEIVHSGVLELQENGDAWLRVNNSVCTAGKDVFVTARNVKSWNLREGDRVAGTVVQRADIGAPELKNVLSLNSLSLPQSRKDFNGFEPRYPEEKIPLSLGKNSLSMRYLDLFIPIGKGQRVVVSAPSTMDTNSFMQDVAYSINRMGKNGQNYQLVMLLIGESPETVTEFLEVGAEDVFYTTFDKPSKEHLRIARLAIARAQRLAESGKEVVLLINSLTRLALATDDMCIDGKALSCGLNVNVFSYTREALSLARNLKDGASVTVIATLLDGELPVQQAIKEECMPLANCQIYFSKEVSRMGVSPAIDLTRSATYRAEKLLAEMESRCNDLVRQKYLQDGGKILNDGMRKFERNADFVENLLKQQ